MPKDTKRKMPKMLFFHENFVLGGDTIYLETILRGMQRDEFVLVYGGSNSVTHHIESCEFNPSTIKFDSYDESFFIFAANNKKFIIKLILRALIKLFSIPMKIILWIRLKKFLLALGLNRFDRIIINSGGFYGTECSRLFLKAAKGKRSYYILHNHIPDKVLNDKNEFSSIDKYVGEWVIGSKFIRRQLIDKCGVLPERVNVIPYGIKPSVDPRKIKRNDVRDKLNLPRDAYVILHPSVFEKRKGHYYTLHAFRDLKQEIVCAKLVLAGTDGADRKIVEDLVYKLGIEDDVLFTGFYSPLEELIVAADVLCLPCQEFDTTPFVVLLAFACCVPVLTTRREDFEDDLSDGENALLVPTGDYKTITEKLIYLYKNETLKNRLIENGAKTYKNLFSEDRMLDDTIKIFQNQ